MLRVLTGGFWSRSAGNFEISLHYRLNNGKNNMNRALFVLSILLWSSTSFAQKIDDPYYLAKIPTPDLSGSKSPSVVKDGWKFFFFHKSDVSFVEAHADFSDCYRFLAPSGYVDVLQSSFVPWREENPSKGRVVRNGYAPLGGVIMKVFNLESGLARGDRQAKMRRCMEPRGYKRYGVAQDIWENMTSMKEQEAIAMQAKIASGPLFNGEEPTK
jgi:hypothetical protein